MQNDAILRFARVSEITGLGRTSIYTMMQRGEFPRGIKLGERATGWRMSEIQQWIDRCAAQRDKGRK
ncbi:MAG: AlpA family transcriptional regulator [Betaproteobacteria bacterium]|nr:AlpA family transcriptional regulator [Betaproteobacteria bacterium]